MTNARSDRVADMIDSIIGSSILSKLVVVVDGTGEILRPGGDQEGGDEKSGDSCETPR